MRQFQQLGIGQFALGQYGGRLLAQRGIGSVG